MEFIVPVNEMIREDITKLDYTLIPPGLHGDGRRIRLVQQTLFKHIDMLGEQSALAQGLKKAITSAEKLRNSPTQTVYLLKDSSAKEGQGELIALLKVARKHLYLYDSLHKLYEVEPLCVLDFFVLQDRQRLGHGRTLFDHMLQDMKISSVQDLAIDGPSPKMLKFLVKHYGVDKWTTQSNNFAVCPSFFKKAEEISKLGRSKPVIKPAAGRFTASKTSVADTIHGEK